MEVGGERAAIHFDDLQWERSYSRGVVRLVCGGGRAAARRRVVVGAGLVTPGWPAWARWVDLRGG